MSKPQRPRNTDRCQQCGKPARSAFDWFCSNLCGHDFVVGFLGAGGNEECPNCGCRKAEGFGCAYCTEEMIRDGG